MYIIHIHIYACTRTYTHIRTYVNTYIHTYAHTHVHTHTHTHTHTCMHARTHTYTHTRARAHTHTHTHTYIRTHIHSYTRTNTHTYIHGVPRRAVNEQPSLDWKVKTITERWNTGTGYYLRTIRIYLKVYLIVRSQTDSPKADDWVHKIIKTLPWLGLSYTTNGEPENTNTI
jgi:hypothetical protein